MKIIPLLASMLAASLAYDVFAYFILGANDEYVTRSLFGAGLGFITWSCTQDFKSKVSPSLRNSVLVSTVSLSVLWLLAAVGTMLNTFLKHSGSWPS